MQYVRIYDYYLAQASCKQRHEIHVLVMDNSPETNCRFCYTSILGCRRSSRTVLIADIILCDPELGVKIMYASYVYSYCLCPFVHEAYRITRKVSKRFLWNLVYRIMDCCYRKNLSIFVLVLLTVAEWYSVIIYCMWVICNMETPPSECPWKLMILTNNLKVDLSENSGL